MEKKITAKILLFIITIITAGSILSKQIYAADEFYTSYNITYTVNPDTSVSVVQKVSLQNKTASVYASQYKVTLNSTRIRSIWAKDNFAVLQPQIEKGSNFTRIMINFPNIIVGKGNVLNFSIGYTSDDYAMKNGRVLEIGIPKIAEAHNLTNYQINLVIPNEFENPAFIQPKPNKVISNNNNTTYVFHNDILKESITAAFGNFQIFNFQINYSIKNNNLNPTNFEVAFPPETPYQQVIYHHIHPVPQNITIDADGNWLGSYLINPDETKQIEASGSAKILINPDKSRKLNNIVKKEYLKKDKFWPVEDEQIQSLALDLKTADKIYKYVSENLIYDYAKVEFKPERLGANVVLQDKASAVCMEFTDLFITIARAAGIPAREVNGFAYTNNPKLRPISLNQDVLHSWPQYYDESQNIWISIDPTWANTTGGIDFFNHLDLNHFSFVFHGQNSEYPLTPGSYKKEGDDQKQIIIDFGNNFNPDEKYKLKANFPESIKAGLPITGNVILENRGNVLINNKKFTVKVDNQDKAMDYEVKKLPPFAHFAKEINIPKTNFLENDVKNITITLDNENYYYSVKIKSSIPKFFNKMIQLVINKLEAIFKHH